jgi:2-oxoglutarate ferredoxin oxidoreductase subunit alpha
MAVAAFDIAEQLQTPVFVLSDLDLGMNIWMSDPFPYPESAPARGKLLSPEKLAEIGGTWGRYRDVDGDGVPYRTIPGDGMPVYFTRGSGHNEQAQYSERPDDYARNVVRLARKFETARTLLPPPEIDVVDGASVGMVAFGTSHWAVVESRDQLTAEAGLSTSYCRLRAWPFTPALGEFIDRHDRVYVVEQNRDGQMLGLMRTELSAAQIEKLRSIRHFNGLPLDARTISEDVLFQEGHPLGRAVDLTAVGMSGGSRGGE